MSPKNGRSVLGCWSRLVTVVLLLGTLVSAVPKAGGPTRSLAQGHLPGAGRRPIEVGQIKEIELQIGYGSEIEIHHPGATYIKIHVRELDLAVGAYITISDPGGAQTWSYPGGEHTIDGQGGFWALSVIGDTALVKLHGGAHGGAAEKARTAPAAVIDMYAHGYPLAELDAGLLPQSVCGEDDRRDVACYAASFPSEYERSGAVALMLIDGQFLCTAWRASPLNRLFTNAHCVSTPADVAASEVWFNYQRAACKGDELASPTIVAANTLLSVDRELDYALFTVSRFSSIAAYGYLELDVRAPVLGEEIYIPQHGEGHPKELAIESDRDEGGLCQVREPSLLGFDPDQETDAGYYCDTFVGSSGAPVLARSSHQVIGIHHLGPSASCNKNNLNQAVRIDQIWPQVSSCFHPGDPAGDVRINELDLWIPDAIELYNAGTQAVDMAEWALMTYGANGTVEIEYTFPMFSLPPGGYVVLHEGSGSNTDTDLYLNHQISWLGGGDGAALLLGSQGRGIDFVRFGSSTVPPSAGTTWEGANAPSPAAGQTLGRDALGRDTDDGRDWALQMPTLGGPNLGGARPEIHVTPLDLQEALVPGQVVTKTVTIGNSGTVTLAFQIESRVPDGVWLRVVPLAGEIPPLAEAEVAVIVHADGLPAGAHTAEVVIHSNDADRDPVVVPVTVHVGSLWYMPAVFSPGP